MSSYPVNSLSWKKKLNEYIIFSTICLKYGHTWLWKQTALAQISAFPLTSWQPGASFWALCASVSLSNNVIVKIYLHFLLPDIVRRDLLSAILCNSHFTNEDIEAQRGYIPLSPDLHPPLFPPRPCSWPHLFTTWLAIRHQPCLLSRVYHNG